MKRNLSIYKLSYRQNQKSLTVTAKSFARNALWWNGPTRPIRFLTGSLPSQVFGTTIPRAGSPCTPTTPYCLNNFREPPNHIQRKTFIHLIVYICITSYCHFLKCLIYIFSKSLFSMSFTNVDSHTRVS